MKSLRKFSGKPGVFSLWKKSVERVVNLFDCIKDTSYYYVILYTIRTKIIGEVKTAIDSCRTTFEWTKIRKCLIMHYSDKRDIGTLEYQMTMMCQGSRTITNFTNPYISTCRWYLTRWYVSSQWLMYIKTKRLTHLLEA